MARNDVRRVRQHPDPPALKPAVFHVLLALAEGATHGYGAMQAVREQSGGRVSIGTASFYRHLTRLIDDGLVVEASGAPGRRRPAARRLLSADAAGPARPRRRTHAAGGPRGGNRRPDTRRGEARRDGAAARPSAERFYGLLLRAYPARVRARFAAGMTYAFGHELDEAQANGVRALLAFWLTTIVTTVWFGFSARCDRVPHVDPAEAYGDLTMRQRFTIDWRDAWRSLGRRRS